MSLWMVGVIAANALAGSAKAGASAIAQKYNYKMAAQTAQYKSTVARMNAQVTALERNAQMAALESQALQAGLKDAQVRSATYIQQANQGVALNSASKYQQRASQELMHVISQNNIDAQRVHNLSALENKKVNYMGQAIMEKGNALANNIGASSVNVFENRLLGGIMQGASTTLSMLAMSGMSTGGPKGGTGTK